jgi:B12-binding domain/radical SAM domain protein
MTPLLPKLVDLIAGIKKTPEYMKNESRTLMIAGGPHPSGDPVSAAAMGFDLTFSGEAEYMWPEFLRKAVAEGGSEKFKENIISEYSSSVIFDAREAPLDLYQPFSSLTAHIPPLEIMRGCYYNCRFCQTACSRVRFRSVESSKLYFEEYRRRGYKKISFVCPSAFHYMSEGVREINFEAVESLLASAVEFGSDHVAFGLFPSETRPETVTARSVALIDKYCGNRKMSVGVQSGDESRMKSLGRGHGLDAVYEACGVISSFGITPIADFIFGFPDETEQEQIRTLDVIRHLHSKYGALVQTHFFMPLPGTPIYHKRFSKIWPRSLAVLEKFEKDGICHNCYEGGIKLSETVCGILDGLVKK